MFAAALFALLAVGRPGPSILDRDTLAQVAAAVKQMTDEKESFLRFNRELPRSGAPAWRRLQRCAAPNSEEYVALSFALAYYGIDYGANLERIMRPYRLWSRHIDRWVKEYNWPDDGNGTGVYYSEPLFDLSSVYHLLNLQYLRHHDLDSLGRWLDMRLDGHWADESDTDLSSLWNRHEADMLRAVFGSPRRLKNLAAALDFDRFCEGTRPARRAKRRFLAELRRRSHDRDRRVAVTTVKLARALEDIRDPPGPTD
jgi:hypothetical protein